MFDLMKSPIRENVNSLKEGQLSIFEDDELNEETEENYRKLQVRTILKDVEKMLETMEDNQGQAVRIAVMGEVKAGKSTFVNACVGKEVAYTDILEATAVVSEITYSEEEYVHILDTQGNIVKDMTAEELLEWTEEQIDDEADFTQYGRIEIGVDNDFLEQIIFVDTPGLLSITEKNHDVTNQYVAQADYILWVINSRDLGSKAVNDYIDKLALSGKPMIGIINKVDSEEVRAEIEEYIVKEYGNVFEEIFYVSSANAWDKRKNGQPDWAEQTGFSGVMECIEDLGEDKEHSTDRTRYYQYQRDREVHLIMKERIQKRKEYYDSELSQFANVNRKMKQTIRRELNHWIEKELYMDEKADLMDKKGESYESSLQKYSDAAYLSQVVDQKYQEMAGFIQKKWEIIENRLMEQASEVLIDFKYDRSILSDTWEEPETAPPAFSGGGTRKMLQTGTMASIAFAGFAAWLGPAAASVSFVSALPAAIPLGIGVGVWSYLRDQNRVNTGEAMHNARKRQQEAEDLYQSVKNAVAAKKEELERTLWACTDYYYEERCSLYKEKAGLLHFDFTEPSYGRFLARLDEYLAGLNREIAQLEPDDIPAPPSAEEMEGEGLH